MRSLVARTLHQVVLLSFAATSPVVACGQSTGSGDPCSTSGPGTFVGTLGTSGAGAGNGTPMCSVKSFVARCVSACSSTFDLVGPSSACTNLGNCTGVCPSPRDAVAGGTLASAADGGPPLASVTYCRTYDDSTGGHVQCGYCPLVGGRRPQGLIDDRASGPDSTARFLARAAHLEAASVDAFDRLTRELEAHGAPRRLRAGSRRAARDEVRHARVTKELAEWAGAIVAEVRVEPSGVRSLEEMAIENAVEGCVRETFGAAVAMIQAKRAGDANVRAAMKGIARDETRHAELAMAVGRWLDTKLDSGARGRVQKAREEAIAGLLGGAVEDADADLAARVGVPRAPQVWRLVEGLRATLWS